MAEGGLTPVDRERYRCQMLVEGFGEEAQLMLSASTVGVIGLGGLGSASCEYLAAAGIGRLIIADGQTLEVSDLGRQVLHWELDVTELRTKVESAAWKLRRINSRVETIKVPQVIDANNADGFLAGAGVILDCTNDSEAHAVLNKYCVEKGVPLVFATAARLSGALTTILPGTSPCLECVMEKVPSKGAGTELVAAAAGVFGTLQAIEAIKLLTGRGEPLASKVLLGDMGCNSWDVVEVPKRNDCPVCGGMP